MAVTLLVLGLVTCILSYAAIYMYVPKRFVGLSGLVVTCFLVGLGMLSWSYVARPTVKVFIDTFLRPSTQHTVISVPDRTLPLPPKTTLRGRHSREGATYYTRLTGEEVVSFYKRTSQIEHSEVANDNISFTVTSGNGRYEITITPEWDGANIRVEGE